MSILSKYALRNTSDYELAKKRNRLLASLNVQLDLFLKIKAGQDIAVAGKTPKLWFKEVSGGYSVVCKYGSVIMKMDEASNSIFVEDFLQIEAVLRDLIASVQSGEFDSEIILSSRKLGGRDIDTWM